jgi:hypothetical protein
VRATVLVAFVDAVGIGLALVLIRVPLALPLAALVFLGAFIPVVGATLSGAVAVLVALVTQGPVAALLVLIAVIAVQQLEGHVLQPLLLGRAVALHPLGVILALTGGVVLGGIVGALIAPARHPLDRRRPRSGGGSGGERASPRNDQGPLELVTSRHAVAASRARRRCSTSRPASASACCSRPSDGANCCQDSRKRSAAGPVQVVLLSAPPTVPWICCA